MSGIFEDIFGGEENLKYIQSLLESFTEIENVLGVRNLYVGILTLVAIGMYKHGHRAQNVLVMIIIFLLIGLNFEARHIRRLKNNNKELEKRLRNVTSELRIIKRELYICNMKFTSQSKQTINKKGDINSCDEIHEQLRNCTRQLTVKNDRTYQMQKNADMMDYCLKNPDTKTVEPSSYFGKGAEHHKTTTPLCVLIAEEYRKFNAQVHNNHIIHKEKMEFKKGISGNKDNNSGTDSDELDRER